MVTFNNISLCLSMIVLNSTDCPWAASICFVISISSTARDRQAAISLSGFKLSISSFLLFVAATWLNTMSWSLWSFTMLSRQIKRLQSKQKIFNKLIVKLALLSRRILGEDVFSSRLLDFVIYRENFMAIKENCHPLM